MDTHLPELPVFPPDLDAYIENDSAMAILCLGQQNVIDVIPKSNSGSVLGKVDVGRLFPDHGAAVFLSKDAIKRYQVRSEVGRGVPQAPCTKPSYRLIFFRSKTDQVDENDDTMLWDNKDLPNESIKKTPFCNILSYRMGQVHIYQHTLDKFTKADFTLLLDALEQHTSATDSLDDMKTRAQVLLEDPYSSPSYPAASVLVNKMKHKEVKEELTACHLDSSGTVAICKQRLCRYLTKSADQTGQVCGSSEECLTYSPVHQLSETAPTSNQCTSPTDFHFTSSLPNAKDFLKSNPGIYCSTQPRNRGKRKRDPEKTGSSLTFQGLESYLKSLDAATDNELIEELGFLKLSTDGGFKAKKKRITQHLQNPSALSSETTAEHLNQIQNRLEVIEKSNVSISSIITDIKKNMDELKLTKSPTSNSSGNCKTASTCVSGADLLRNLTKANQDTSLLLEKSHSSLQGLTQTLKDTMTLKKDLETWHQSVFRSDDSDRINEIHKILSKSNLTDLIGGNKKSSHDDHQDSERHVAKSPRDTRTNKDIPGLPADHHRRSSSYRRQHRDSLQRNGSSSRNRKSTCSSGSRSGTSSTTQQKVVLLCDSTMRSFKSQEFSKRYKVSVIYRRSWEELQSSLNSTAEEISNLNPDAVYIHLGTRDILNGKDADSLVNMVVNGTEKILKETSQQCKLFISHPIICSDPESEPVRIGQSLSETVENLKADSNKAEFWVRTKENKNANFYPEGSNLPHKYMFASNQSQLNGRGIRVIMGNFRTSLNSIFDRARP